MRLLIPVVCACLFGPAAADAQPSPRSCTVHVEVDVPPGPQEKPRVIAGKTTCNFKGKIKFLVNNYVDQKFKIKLHDFRVRAGGNCTTPPSGDAVDIPLSKPNKKELTLSVSASEESSDVFLIKNGNGRECFKFDVSLYDEDWIFISHLDPDLEVTEPGSIITPKK